MPSKAHLNQLEYYGLFWPAFKVLLPMEYDTPHHWRFYETGEPVLTFGSFALRESMGREEPLPNERPVVPLSQLIKRDAVFFPSDLLYWTLLGEARPFSDAFQATESSWSNRAIRTIPRAMNEVFPVELKAKDAELGNRMSKNGEAVFPFYAVEHLPLAMAYFDALVPEMPLLVDSAIATAGGKTNAPRKTIKEHLGGWMKWFGGVWSRDDAPKLDRFFYRNTLLRLEYKRLRKGGNDSLSSFEILAKEAGYEFDTVKTYVESYKRLSHLKLVTGSTLSFLIR